jgi:septal ring factor EnvC (AmiA/AmiB activator)
MTSEGASDRAYDWSRLERAVATLVARHRRLQDELCTLRVELADRDHHLRRLEAQLIEANQRRQDAVKHIDELISQLDQLDAQLMSAESAQ